MGILEKILQSFLSVLLILVFLGFRPREAGAGPNPVLAPAETWQVAIELAFPASAREERIDRLFSEDLAGRFRSHGIQPTLSKKIQADHSLSYTLVLEGSKGREQFRQALFASTDPTLPFTAGPTRLILQGGHRRGERIPLTLEANLASGYTWEVEAVEGPGLAVRGPGELTSRVEGLGVSGQQLIPLEALEDGAAVIRLLYRRPWLPDRLPEKIVTLKADRLELIADLTDPRPAPVKREQAASSTAPAIATPALGLPAAFDWRSSGILTPVKDQGNCGSCWAFGTVGPFEAGLIWKAGIHTDLSEEFLLSCNTNGYSCNGGWWAHEYHLNKVAVNQTAAGAVLETSFPYQAAKLACTQSFDHPYRLTGWSYVSDDSTIPSVEALKNAIYNYGPVAVAVCANTAMQNYRGGIFTNTDTTECGANGINHAVVLVGWNDVEDTWIMRNSWGAAWGEAGYMRIKRGVLNIGYAANYVTYSNPFIPTHRYYFPLFQVGPSDPAPAGILGNGDFESGRDGSWGESSTNGFTLILARTEGLAVTPHSGSWAAWLGGADYEISLLSQRITVPLGAEALHYWIWIGSQEYCFPADPYDTAEVLLGDVRLRNYELCTGTSTSGWIEEAVDLTGFQGQTRDLIFKATTDHSNNSNFFLDDVVITTLAGDRVPIGIRGAP